MRAFTFITSSILVVLFSVYSYVTIPTVSIEGARLTYGHADVSSTDPRPAYDLRIEVDLDPRSAIVQKVEVEARGYTTISNPPAAYMTTKYWDMSPVPGLNDTWKWDAGYNSCEELMMVKFRVTYSAFGFEKPPLEQTLSLFATEPVDLDGEKTIRAIAFANSSWDYQALYSNSTANDISAERICRRQIISALDRTGAGGVHSRRIVHTLASQPDTPGNVEDSILWALHVYTARGYNPSSSGAINSVRYSFSRSWDTQFPQYNPGDEIGTYVALVQDGTVYAAHEQNHELAAHSPQTISSEFVQSDFRELQGMTFDGNNEPDFSTSGSPILFGLVLWTSTNNSEGDATAHFLESFQVEVH